MLIGKAHIDRAEAVRVISGAAAQWVLNCGASTHVTNGKTPVSKPIPIEEPTAVLTANGIKSLGDSVFVRIPCIDGLRSAIVAARNPDLAIQLDAASKMMGTAKENGHVMGA